MKPPHAQITSSIKNQDKHRNLNRQFEAFTLHDFGIVYVEEVGVNECLNDTSKECNVVEMFLSEVPIEPVRNV